jgi:hypothetical protein
VRFGCSQLDGFGSRKGAFVEKELFEESRRRLDALWKGTAGSAVDPRTY